MKAIAPMSRFLILHADVQLFQYHLLKYDVFALCQRFFDYIYGDLCLGSLFCFISLFFFFLILQHCHDYYSDIIILEVRSISPPTLLFFFNIVLAMLSLLPPYQNGQNPEYWLLKWWQECGERRMLTLCWWECKMVHPLWKITWCFLRN